MAVRLSCVDGLQYSGTELLMVLAHPTPLLRTPSCRSGVAAVEFAVVLPLLVGLIIGIWEVGRMIETKQILTNAAREGGRQAALGESDAQVRQAVLDYLQSAGWPTQNAVVPNVTKNTESTGETSVRVRVEIPYRDVRWINLYLVTDANTRLSAESVWYMQ